LNIHKKREKKRMQRSEIISAIDEELSTLRRVRDLLQSSDSSAGIKAIAEKVTSTGGRKRRVMSPEARARIGLAQKKRWAKQRKAESATGDK
jgi:hypothetical protein